MPRPEPVPASREASFTWTKAPTARPGGVLRTVSRNWDSGTGENESVTDLRQAVALDPKLKVLIVHGYDDLSCPYFASMLIVDQTPVMGDPMRAQLKLYRGGHMLYLDPDSRHAFSTDVKAFYQEAS